MGSKSQQNKIAGETTEEAVTASQDAQAATATPIATSTADTVLSASQGQVTVGGVTVIEHEQDNGEASQEAGGA